MDKNEISLLFPGRDTVSFKTVEKSLQAAIHIRFGLPSRLPAEIATLIKRADRVAAFSEAVDLAGFAEAEARKVLGYRRKVRSAPLVPETPDQAKTAFLNRFHALFDR